MDGTYQAFLLRLQRFHDHGKWRVTLQDVQTNETIRFANEMELVTHLLHLLGEPIEPDPPAASGSQ